MSDPRHPGTPDPTAPDPASGIAPPDAAAPDTGSTGPPGRRRLVVFGPGDNQDEIALADILRNESVGGVLMLIATVIALVAATVAYPAYDGLRHVQLGPLDLEHWAKDGLLTIFFFVAGLELKRELRAGSLRRPSQALVPIVAAVCGMAVPAGFYLLVNGVMPGGDLRGWAIPMATDIAFALAVLAVAAPSLPSGLRAFLLTLAIVDDLGAIIVIAVVFTASLQLLSLVVALVCAAIWFALQQRRVDRWWLFVPLFVLCWWFMHESGVHATIAGVLLGLLTRTSPNEAHDPVDRWEHFWQPISAAVVVPVFALMAAGVRIDPTALLAVVTTPMPLGIVVGLVLGKAVGVTAGALLTIRLTGAQLHGGVTSREVFSVGLLAGVGFTVSLLVADLTFGGDAALTEQAKAAVLLASLLAGVLATISLRLRVRRRRVLAAAADSDGAR